MQAHIFLCVVYKKGIEMWHVTQPLLFGFQDSVNFFQLDVQRVNVIF